MGAREIIRGAPKPRPSIGKQMAIHSKTETKRRSRRSAFSMIEVVAVLVVLAAAALAANMFAPLPATRSMEASSESRALMATLRTARQSAIASGIITRVRFQQSNGQLTSYVIERDGGAGNYLAISPIHAVAALPLRTSNASEVLFQPTGSASQSLRVEFGNGRQKHEVTLATANGMVRYAKK